MPSPSVTGQPDSPRAWFGSMAGSVLLASEQALIAHALAERPAQPWLCLAPLPQTIDLEGHGLWLALSDDGWQGGVRCGLPLPLAKESIGTVVVQHVARLGLEGQALLDECARVLVPGGRLWLFALNPLAPYRWRWRGNGLRASEPLTWRRRLRQAGLVPDAVSQGIGPNWQVQVSAGLQSGAGLRAAYAIRAEKRAFPMTPIRQRAPLRLPGGVTTA